MSKKIIRSRDTWLAYALLGLYAYFLNIFGPITPFLHSEFNLSYTISSLHTSAFALGILGVGLAGHLFIRRLGHTVALAVGAAGLGVGAMALVFGRPPLTILGGFGMGCVGSLILAVVPAVLSAEHGEGRAVAISEANGVGSLLATAAPIFVGWAAGFALGWRLALASAALMALAIGAALLLFSSRRSGVVELVKGKGRLPPRFWFYWLALVLGVAIEFCMIFWSADFMESELSIPRASAAQAVSLFLGGMILGRLAASRLLRFFSPRGLVFGSLIVGLGGFLLFWQVALIPVALTGLAVAGLGVAGLYPLLLSLAVGSARDDEPRASARTTLASGVAILALPLTLGRLADLAGLNAAFGLVAGLFLILLAMSLLGREGDGRKRNLTASL